MRSSLFCLRNWDKTSDAAVSHIEKQNKTKTKTSGEDNIENMVQFILKQY